MSHINIRNELSTALEGAVSVPIAYENYEFDSNNNEAFVAQFYLPQTSEGMGKTFASSDDERGAFQISVFIQVNALDGSGEPIFDTLQLEIIDDIKTVFYTNAFIGEVYIDSVEVGAGSIENGWYKRDATVNWISYQTRG